MSIANIRRERLQGEYKRLMELQADSNMIRLFPLKPGDAPDEYRIVMRCRGIRNVHNNVPEYAEEHIIEIKLGAGFPQHNPDIRTGSLIYHPNIVHAQTGQICINAWTPIRRLDEVVEQIYNMIRYLPEVTNPGSPYNSQAAIWYRHNSRLFPTDPHPIRGGAVPIDIITIPDTPPDIGIRIVDEEPLNSSNGSNLLHNIVIYDLPPASGPNRTAQPAHTNESDSIEIVIY